MGNHTAGKAMGRAAELVIARRLPTDTAVSLLDIICGPYRGCDAEFEAEDPARPGFTHPSCHDFRYPHKDMALGLLMLEAFAPNGIADLDRYRSAMDSADDNVSEQADEDWWNEVCDPFRNRYNFC
jgi:hypothetical protein